MAWGFSIHAYRRIHLFVDDPEFEVSVVSTHNYKFENAMNILLTDAKRKNETGNSGITQQGRIGEKIKIIIGERLGKLITQIVSVLYRSPLILPLHIFYDFYKGIKDIKIIKSAVKEFNPDVIFLQTLLYPCYLAYFLPRSLPIMITFWNGDVVWWAKWNGIERLFKKQIVQYGVRRAQGITVNSKMAFNACLGYGATSDKIHLIPYPGVDLERFRPFSKKEAREKLGITSSKVVLCPRGLGGFLNSDVIVESAAAVIKKNPDILFLFISGVGGETELEKHKYIARKLGIEKNFRWDGQVPWEVMPLYYSSSDVMVSISSNDSLPNCMLEAMACRVPVIMGDIPQIKERVIDSVNGFLVPPRDPVALSDRIMKVFEDPDGNIKLFAKKNLELVMHQFDSKKNVKQVKDLVHLIAKKSLTSKGV